MKKLLESNSNLPNRWYEITDYIYTIPEDITAVANRPDLTIIDQWNKRLLIVELTALFDTNLGTGENTKQTKHNRDLIPVPKKMGGTLTSYTSEWEPWQQFFSRRREDFSQSQNSTVCAVMYHVMVYDK